MANLLKMANVQSILLLHVQGWTQRRIARELEIDRGTVRKYLRQQLCRAKPANAPTGSDESKPANVLMVPAPGPKPATAPVGASGEPAGSKPANAPTGSAANSAMGSPITAAFPAGQRSRCVSVGA